MGSDSANPLFAGHGTGDLRKMPLRHFSTPGKMLMLDICGKGFGFPREAPSAGGHDDERFSRSNYALEMSSLSQCTMCCLYSMFSFQPNKLRHILNLSLDISFNMYLSQLVRLEGLRKL